MKRFHKVIGLFFAAGLLTALLLFVGSISFAAKGGGGGGKPPKNSPSLIPLKVILMAGQSNMVGRGLNTDLATLAPELQLPQTDVQIFHNGSWSDLQPGFGSAADKYGPELAFGRFMADALPDDNIALIKVASGGTDLANDWNPDTPGFMWTRLVNAVDSALATIDTTVYAPQIVGMAWMQGGRDSIDLNMALAYEQNLTNFIAAVRTEFGVPNLPFVIGQIPYDDELYDVPIVKEAQLNVWLNVPNTGLIFTSDISMGPDGIHWDSAGTLEIGERFATEMLTAFPVDVDSVIYATSGGKGGIKNLTVTVAIGDEMGPVNGASVSITLVHESGDFWDATGTTGSDGTVDFPLRNALKGLYVTTVTDVNAGVFDWDGLTPPNEFRK